MNIAVAGPQILMRRALCALLAQVRDIRVVADFDRAIDNVEALQKAQADMLVIDALEPMRELDTVGQLCKLLPDVKVLLLSDIEDEEFQVRAVKLGVRGCFSKRSEPQAFERALRAIGQRGEVWVSHQVAAQIIGKFMDWEGSQQAPVCQLTPREWEILSLVASGCHNKEIGRRLFISENTIKTHLYTIYKKLGVNSRLGAAMHYFHQAKQKAVSHDNGKGLPPLTGAVPPVISIPEGENAEDTKELTVGSDLAPFVEGEPVESQP